MNTAFRTKTPFASTLPGRYYYDPTIYAQEQERIFSKMWVYACRYHAWTYGLDGQLKVNQFLTMSMPTGN